MPRRKSKAGKPSLLFSDESINDKMIAEGAASSSDEQPSSDATTEEETEMDPNRNNLYDQLEAQLSKKTKRAKAKERPKRDEFMKHLPILTPTTTDQQSDIGKRQERQNARKKRNVNVTPNQPVIDNKPLHDGEIQYTITNKVITNHIGIGLQDIRTPTTEAFPEIQTHANTHTNTESVTIPSNPALARVTTRPALTEEQRQHLMELNSRTVYIAGEGGELVQMFKSQPRQLQKELIEKAGGPVDKVYRTDRGLKVIASNESQKKKLMAMTMFNGKQVIASLPFAMTRPHTAHLDKIPQPASQEANYYVKGVIHGLLESQENLDEIAGEIGAHHMKRIGRDPTTSKTTLIAYPREMNLPQYVAIDGQRFKVYPFIPKPRRCDRCQRFGHLPDHCPNNVICSRCSGNHAYNECPNKDAPKCANCFQEHSAAHRQCPVYIKTQEVLKVRAIEKVTYAQAVKRVEETAKQPIIQGRPTPLPIPNVPTPWATTLNTQTSNIMQDFPTQPTKEFLSINAKKYKAVNTTTPPQDMSEDSHIQIANIVTFVLGCLSTIDKEDSKTAIKNMICKVASDFLFSGNINFCWRDIHN